MLRGSSSDVKHYCNAVVIVVVDDDDDDDDDDDEYLLRYIHKKYISS